MTRQTAFNITVSSEIMAVRPPPSLSATEIIYCLLTVLHLLCQDVTVSIANSHNMCGSSGKIEGWCRCWR